MNPSTKTYHAKNFELLKGAAANVATTLKKNPTPNKDQIENLEAAFKALDKQVKLYTDNTPKAAPVGQKYDKAHAEWQLVKHGKGDSKKIVAEMEWISKSPYVSPTGAVERPSTPAPTGGGH